MYLKKTIFEAVWCMRIHFNNNYFIIISWFYSPSLNQIFLDCLFKWLTMIACVICAMHLNRVTKWWLQYLSLSIMDRRQMLWDLFSAFLFSSWPLCANYIFVLHQLLNRLEKCVNMCDPPQSSWNTCRAEVWHWLPTENQAPSLPLLPLMGIVNALRECYVH